MIADSELIVEVLSGAVDRYAELVRRYERSVRAAAWSIVGDLHAAEDVTELLYRQCCAEGRSRDDSQPTPASTAMSKFNETGLKAAVR